MRLLYLYPKWSTDNKLMVFNLKIYANVYIYTYAPIYKWISNASVPT